MMVGKRELIQLEEQGKLLMRSERGVGIDSTKRRKEKFGVMRKACEDYLKSSIEA